MPHRILITGAAGFIGCNAAARFAEEGAEVAALDDFSREGSRRNARWLEQRGGEVLELDVRDGPALAQLVEEVQPGAVLHMAGQVAVTTSVDAPGCDFQVNTAGTLNVLEAVRKHSPDAHVVYASTNKVYGELADVPVVEEPTRYRYRDLAAGVSEERPLDFRTPYGCSKGAADQYVLDWARTYDLKTTSLRQSCIYGPRQNGVEAQGWVGWFVRAALASRPITIYGDGKQVRDLLHVDDLLDLVERVLAKPEASSGHAFNVGGGPDFTLSLLELIDLLESQVGRSISPSFDGWRPGDQRVFYCDVSKARDRLGWKPRISPREGIRRLVEWMRGRCGDVGSPDSPDQVVRT